MSFWKIRLLDLSVNSVSAPLADRLEINTYNMMQVRRNQNLIKIKNHKSSTILLGT